MSEPTASPWSSCLTACPGAGRKPQLLLIVLVCISSTVLIGVTLSSVYLTYPNQLFFGLGDHDFISQTSSESSTFEHFEQTTIHSDKVVNNHNDGKDTEQLDHGKSSSVDFSSEDISEEVVETREGRIRHGQSKIRKVSLEDLRQDLNTSQLIQTRLVHFDLKGAPPRLAYLKEVILLAKSAGMTGVLLEWEDTFPWKGSLLNTTLLEGGYTENEVEDLIHFIESHEMTVIPLIQTFGHVEFILKGSEYRHLRETDDEPQSFCPSKAGSMEIIKDMIDQIVAVHKNSLFVHIGCDEVFNIRQCSKCIQSSESKDDLFLRHVVSVAKLVREHGRIPIIWDDMLRSIEKGTLVDSGIGSLVEPMVWVYAEDVDRFVSWDVWDKYSEIFPTVWGAGAYKGAFGETNQIPPLTRHAQNTQRWMEVLARESPEWSIGGFVLTGWQRYDHFAILCELLPASVPSLVYSSLLLSTEPGTTEPVFRNRIFVPKTAEEMNMVNGTETIPEASSSRPASRRRRGLRRKWIPHPQTLRNKEERVIPQFSGSTSQRLSTPSNGVSVKSERVWTQFVKILHCPSSTSTRDLDRILSSDKDFTHAGRCHFTGVIFFRGLPALRSLVKEAFDLVSKLKRERGWLTSYNVRHDFSVPFRIESLLEDIPRLKRNLSLKAKSLANSLKPIFRNEVILEWLEQNVWEAWLALHKLESEGEQLKVTSVWDRRPFRTPPEIVRDLGLTHLQLLTKPREDL